MWRKFSRWLYWLQQDMGYFSSADTLQRCLAVPNWLSYKQKLFPYLVCRILFSIFFVNVFFGSPLYKQQWNWMIMEILIVQTANKTFLHCFHTVVLCACTCLELKKQMVPWREGEKRTKFKVSREKMLDLNLPRYLTGSMLYITKSSLQVHKSTGSWPTAEELFVS